MNTREAPTRGSWRVKKLAKVLDAKFSIGGVRVGLDSIIGLIPGFGDAAGTILASYIVFEALNHNMSKATLLRMLANVAIDALLGAIPVLGDVFDIFWKANLKNALLFEREMNSPKIARRKSILWNSLLILGIFLVFALAIYLPIIIIITLFS